jgi:WD40 repeat protein
MEKRSSAPPPEPTAVLRGHETAVNAVALHVPPLSASTSTSTAPSQPLLVSGDAGGAVWLWSLRTKRRLRGEPTAHSAPGGLKRATNAEGEGGVLQVAFAEGGQRVLTQGRGQRSCVKLWDTERLGTGGGDAATLSTFPVASLAFCKLSPLEYKSRSAGTRCRPPLQTKHYVLTPLAQMRMRKRDRACLPSTARRWAEGRRAKQ